MGVIKEKKEIIIENIKSDPWNFFFNSIFALFIIGIITFIILVATGVFSKKSKPKPISDLVRHRNKFSNVKDALKYINKSGKKSPIEKANYLFFSSLSKIDGEVQDLTVQSQLKNLKDDLDIVTLEQYEPYMTSLLSMLSGEEMTKTQFQMMFYTARPADIEEVLAPVDKMIVLSSIRNLIDEKIMTREKLEKKGVSKALIDEALSLDL